MRAFLITLYVVMGAVPFGEMLVRRQGFDALRQLHVPYLILQPLAITFGYAIGMRILGAEGTTLRHIVAAFAAVLVFGVTSIFAQGARPWFVFTACVIAGLLASGICAAGSPRSASVLPG